MNTASTPENGSLCLNWKRGVPVASALLKELACIRKSPKTGGRHPDQLKLPPPLPPPATATSPGASSPARQTAAALSEEACASQPAHERPA